MWVPCSKQNAFGQLLPRMITGSGQCDVHGVCSCLPDQQLEIRPQGAHHAALNGPWMGTTPDRAGWSELSSNELCANLALL